MSAAYADKGSGQLRQRSLWEGLGLNDAGSILGFRDSLTGLEYLRRANEIGERGLRIELHAYQSYVFLDWRELHATASKPWDRLCDYLAGRGVPSLDEALINLELRPLHDAVRAALEPSLVHMLAELAEPTHAPATPGKETATKAQRVFFERAWSACAQLLNLALPAYARRAGDTGPINTSFVDSMAPVFRKMLRGAMLLPHMNALFPKPWPRAARRVLPSVDPHLSSTALWGPVLAWIVLQVMAESIDSAAPERVAVEAFDRLRLRDPLAQAFHALGLEGEDGWRAAARVKALLLVECDLCEAKRIPVLKPATSAAERIADPIPHLEASNEDVSSAPQTESALDLDPASASGETKARESIAAEALASEATSTSLTPAGSSTPPTNRPQLSAADLLVPPQYWGDPDVCWLTGAHVADHKTYLVREPYEELLWWLQLPALFRMAAAPTPHRADAVVMSKKIQHALDTLEAAGYRLDKFLETGEPEPPRSGTSKPDPASESAATPPPEKEALESVPKTGKTVDPDPEDLRPQEPLAAQPVGPANPDGPPEEY